jgi:hypothetical protein
MSILGSTRVSIYLASLVVTRYHAASILPHYLPSHKTSALFRKRNRSTAP